MKLTTTQINSLRHSGTSKNIEKIKDISNLYLIIKPTNSKSWLYRYSYNGKAQSIGLGGYPKVSLKQARELTDYYNSIKSAGQDPKQTIIKKQIDERKLFSNLANEWYEQKQLREPTRLAYRLYLDNDIIPYFADKAIDAIKMIDLASFIQSYTATKSKQKKLKGILSGIYKYATTLGLCEYNLMLNDFSPVLATGFGGNYAFINPVLQKKEFSLLLTKIDAYIGGSSYMAGLRLAPLLAFRPNMLVSLKWKYLNIAEELLIIPAELMKMKEDFKQPLSKQAFGLIMQLHATKKDSGYILPNRSGKNHISANKLRSIIQSDLGFNGNRLPRQTLHGFRHSVSTGIYYLQRQSKWQSEAIEMILDHRKRNQIQAIYNTYEYIDERREILQVWANYLDELKSTVTQEVTQDKKD